MVKDRTNLLIAVVISASILFVSSMACYVYYIVEEKNPRSGGNAKNGAQKTISVIGFAEKVFVADVMEINANFVDNSKRDKFKKYVIAQGIAAEQIVVFDKKLKIESDLIRKMEQIFNDEEQTKLNAVAYELPKYYFKNTEEVKLELLAAGTKNALSKAEVIATNANSSLGALIYSDAGSYSYLNMGSLVEYKSPAELDVFSRRQKAKILIEQVYRVN